jgi:hypothetical protein
MQYICEHRHIKMSAHYVRILVQMASACAVLIHKVYVSR